MVFEDTFLARAWGSLLDNVLSHSHSDYMNNLIRESGIDSRIWLTYYNPNNVLNSDFFFNLLMIIDEIKTSEPSDEYFEELLQELADNIRVCGYFHSAKSDADILLHYQIGGSE